MKDLTNGIELKDRKQLLKSYTNCFVGDISPIFIFSDVVIGQEAVDWMLKNLPIRDRDDAVNLGNKLLQSRYIRCVNGDPKKGFRYMCF